MTIYRYKLLVEFETKVYTIAYNTGGYRGNRHSHGFSAAVMVILLWHTKGKLMQKILIPLDRA